MRKRITITASICMMILMLSSASAFADAGEYQTGIPALTFGSYEIPAYDGDLAEEINGGLPAFTAEELYSDPYVHYGDLDALGRCTAAESLLSEGLMPTGARGSISSVKPSGWVQAKYDLVPGGWLWNRCHLIGWQLAGADENTLSKSELAKDLITGTRYLNVGEGGSGMVGYENEVAGYLKEDPENEVAYRVTPVFAEDNLVAYGVLMEGQSVSSNDVEFCSFCYNVQPEIAINYATGESRLASALPENTPISECRVTVGEKIAYNGSERRVSVEVRDGDKVLTEGVDYETVWRSNTLPGKASVTIAGIGAYKGSTVYNFMVVPAKAKIRKLSSDSGSIRVEAKKEEGVSGYQYAWRIGSKGWSKASVNRNVRILRGLKNGSTYQVKVRAYKKIDGERWYGKWSTVSKVRVRK